MNALNVSKVSKFYDDFKAVENVSFSIPAGKIFGLLGPNGAGKTTTMRMIMNIILPDEGQIEILGKPFREETKNRIGYLPEERGLYPKMKLLPHLQFLGEMKGLRAAEAKKNAADWLDRFELTKWAENKIQDLSKGMQQKVQFIGTILHSPDLLIVDEPFSGLDPVNTKFLQNILLEMKAQGKTIILSTHLMDQAEKLCEEICLINRGRVVLKGNLKEIKSQRSKNTVNIEYSGDISFLSGLPFVKNIVPHDNSAEIFLREKNSLSQLFKKLASAPVEIRKFESAATSLNEIFLEIVEGKSE